MIVLPGLPAPASNEPEVVRVGFVIIHVPTLRLEPCVCGRIKETNDATAIEMARRGDELPADCECGRKLIGQRRLVKVAKDLSSVPGELV